MRIEIIDENKREAWESFINEQPKAIAWQSFKWFDVLKKHYKVDFYPIVAFEGNEIRGILPLYNLKKSHKKNLLMSVPFAVAGGIVSTDAESEKILLDKAIELAGNNDNSNITFKQYKHRVEGQLTTDENYCNKELQLNTDLDKVWNEISEFNRQKVQEGKNFKYKVEHNSKNINEFYDFLFKHHQRKGVPCSSKSWIRDLVESGMYSIAMLHYKGKVVAATMIKEFKDTISFPFSCTSDPESKEFNLVYSLYWEIIKKYSSEGKNICHSGRLPKSGEADQFRQGWGGVQYDYYYQYYPQTTKKTEFNVKRGGKRQMFEKVWMITPQIVTKFVGPLIVKRFP
jgi:serine/alanine adding enzyme